MEYPLETVSKERVAEEIVKGFEQTPRPGDYFLALEESHVLYTIVPEFKGARGCIQGRKGVHYSEDLIQHTSDVLNRLWGNASTDLKIITMLHDIAKIATRTEKEGKIQFLGHDELGGKMVITILTRLRFPTVLVKRASTLIKNHMRLNEITKLPRESQTKPFARLWLDLDEDLSLMKDLIALSEADITIGQVHLGLRNMATEWATLAPLITGEDVIEFEEGIKAENAAIEKRNQRTTFWNKIRRLFRLKPHNLTPLDPVPQPKNRGKLISQMRYIQLTQNITQEGALRIMGGEAKNIASAAT